jgi:tetratricopeptide (TPR) repeat protein
VPQIEFAALCTEKALIHASMGDTSGMLSMVRRGTDAWQRFMAEDRNAESKIDDVKCLMHLVLAMIEAREYTAASTLLDQSIKKLETLAQQKKAGQECWTELAICYREKGRLVKARQGKAQALPWISRAIEVCRAFMRPQDDWEPSSILATCLIEKATCVGDRSAAIRLCDVAIKIFRDLSAAYDVSLLSLQTARGHRVLAMLHGSRDIRVAIDHYERALALYDRLVHELDYRVLGSELAECAAEAGDAAARASNHYAAIRFHEQAIILYEALVHQQGLGDLVKDLSKCHLGVAAALEILHEDTKAAERYDRAIDLLEGTHGPLALTDPKNFGALLEFTVSAKTLSEAHRKCAAVLERIGRHDLARAHALRSSSLSNAFVPSHLRDVSMNPVTNDECVIVEPKSKGDLKALLQTEAARAVEKGLSPFLYLQAAWCPASRMLNVTMRHPLMKEAFRGTYIIKLEADDWSEAVSRAGIMRTNSIPQFIRLSKLGATSDAIDGSAWGENTPACMAPPLRAFLQKERAQLAAVPSAPATPSKANILADPVKAPSRDLPREAERKIASQSPAGKLATDQVAQDKLERFIRNSVKDHFIDEEQENAIFRLGGELELGLPTIDDLLNVMCVKEKIVRYTDLSQELLLRLKKSEIKTGNVSQEAFENIVGYAAKNNMPRKKAVEHCVILMLDHRIQGGDWLGELKKKLGLR